MANHERGSEHKIRKQKKLNFLYVSIIGHIILGLIAAYIIVQVITPRPKPKFVAAPPSPSIHPDVQKQQDTKRQSTMSAPPTQRITTNAAAKITLPSMPAMPSLNASNTMGAGETMGQGFMGNGVGTGAPGGGGVTAFGLRTGVGLKGTFYDLSRDNTGKDNNMTAAKFATIMSHFVVSGMQESLLQNYYKSPDALYTPYIFYPEILSGEASKSFGIPNTNHKYLWCIVYKGLVTAPSSGTFRFIGVGDDFCAVRFNGQPVLDHGSFSWASEAYGRYRTDELWNPKHFPHYRYAYDTGVWYKNLQGHMAGLPFTVNAGQTYDIEVVVGDWGGETQAQVFISKDGETYQKDPQGNPIFPIFRVSEGKLPDFSAGVPPYDHNPPAWSLWKLNTQPAFFH